MTPIFDPTLSAKIETSGIIAVLVVDSADTAAPLARALLAGGVGVMELTLRTPAALDALKKIRAEVPEMIAGVGTILSPNQIRDAKDAGAAFGVAPGMNRNVMATAREAGLSFAPGIATPSDIEAALEFGCRLLKFFPSEPSGGLAYLKSIAAPYAHLGLKYVPLGGISEANMSSYLSEPMVAALGGSWLAPRDLISSGDWKAITAKCAAAVELISSTRTQRPV